MAPATPANHDLIDAYLTHLRVERRLADHTLESYSRDLLRLARWEQDRERRGRDPRGPGRAGTLHA